MSFIKPWKDRSFSRLQLWKPSFSHLGLFVWLENAISATCWCDGPCFQERCMFALLENLQPARIIPFYSRCRVMRPFEWPLAYLEVKEVVRRGLLETTSCMSNTYHMSPRMFFPDIVVFLTLPIPRFYLYKMIQNLSSSLCGKCKIF